MMTALQFSIYKLTRKIPAQHMAEFKRQLEHEARSLAAKKAVKTKRQRYKKWPTRKRDHI